jgi:hypothetical protein
MNYSIIGDEDTVLGFRMVGVTGKVATNSDEARRAFEAMLEDGENYYYYRTCRGYDTSYSEQISVCGEFPTDRGDSRPKGPEAGQAWNQRDGECRYRIKVVTWASLSVFCENAGKKMSLKRYKHPWIL